MNDKKGSNPQLVFSVPFIASSADVEIKFMGVGGIIATTRGKIPRILRIYMQF